MVTVFIWFKQFRTCNQHAIRCFQCILHSIGLWWWENIGQHVHLYSLLLGLNCIVYNSCSFFNNICADLLAGCWLETEEDFDVWLSASPTEDRCDRLCHVSAWENFLRFYHIGCALTLHMWEVFLIDAPFLSLPVTFSIAMSHHACLGK